MAASQIDMNPEIRPKTTHVVVEFNILKQKSSELVLYSWMFTKKNHWYCKYPVGAEMQFAEKYVADNRVPESNWASYKVKILTQAENYDQGVRRLNRYLDGVESLNSAQYMPDQLNERSTSERGRSETLKENVSTNLNQTSSLSQRKTSDDDTASVTSVSGSFIEEIDETLRANRHIVEVASTNRKRQHQKKRPKEYNTGSDTFVKDSFDQLRDQLNKIEKRFGRLERNMLYEMKEQFQNLKLSFVSAEGLQSVGDTLPKCIETLGAELPLTSLENFLEMDESLKYAGEDEEKKRSSDAKRKALKTWMKLMWNGCKSEKDAIYKVLPAIMTKPVQLKFSGAGRKIKGQGKENFSATKIFECMTEILVESYSCNKDGIRGIVGKWLVGAADRDGGKKDRSALQ